MNIRQLEAISLRSSPTGIIFDDKSAQWIVSSDTPHERSNHWISSELVVAAASAITVVSFNKLSLLIMMVDIM